MSAWRGWYHCTGCTYGTWLPGDPRGYRTRHHRHHVNGDYKHPPPAGTDQQLFNRSQRLMKRAKVILTPEQRHIACQAFAQALIFHRVELIELCIGAKHWHGLMRFPFNQDHSPSARRLIGLAKKHSARVLSDSGLTLQGGLWAARCRTRPVTDRAHQLNIVRYIRRHSTSGAAIWSTISKNITNQINNLKNLIDRSNN